MTGFRIVSALAVFWGAGMEMTLLWHISDVLMGVMALINIPVILILSNTVVKTLKDYETKFRNSEILRPKNWGGYIVKPISIEFWQGRANRLHDRIRYTSQEDFSWKIERLSP